MCHYLETYKSNVSGANVHNCALGVDREISFLKRTELSKQSCIVSLGCSYTCPSHPSLLQGWAEMDSSLGEQTWRGAGPMRHFGTQSWKGVIDGPYGMCNGLYQLLKHTQLFSSFPNPSVTILSNHMKEIVNSCCIN